MSYLIRCHLRALILVQFFFLSPTAQTVWQPLTDREAGFTVCFPGKPVYEETRLPQSGDPEETYKFQYGENFLWVKFAPLIRVPRNSVELSQAYAEITSEFSNKGTLVRQEKLQDGGRQYYNISNESAGTLHMLTRIYIHRGRHYQLIYGTFAPAGIDKQVADRLFSSFRFLGVQPGRAASAHNRLPRKVSRRGAECSEWYVIWGRDGDFTAEFPSKPEYSLTIHPELNTEVHKFHLFFGEDLFTLSYWEIPGAKAHPEQALQKVVDAHVVGEKARGQVLRQMSLPGGGYEVESRGVFNDTILYSRVRFYLRSARIYTLATTTPNMPGLDKDNLDRFFAAFHLSRS
jgi:hypothetical protein